jgi:tetraacyldisaccharide 4'-kinase
VIEIDMVFDDPNAAATIIETAVGNCRARLLRENARPSL